MGGLVVAPTSATFTVTSHGAQTDYSVGVVRVHKGSGANAFGGANWTTQHLYAGSGVDDRFASVVFKVGETVVPHRRFNVRAGTSADFILKIPSIPASGTVAVTATWASSGVTTSTDAAVLGWAVDGWERYNGHGIVLPNEGIESTIRYEGGKLRLWYTKQSGVGAVNADVYYRESTDLGQTWSAAGLCVADHNGSFVNVGPDGKWHMLAMDWKVNNRQYVDYYRSDTGAAGTWTLIQANVAGLGPNATSWVPFYRQWGNVSFWHDGAEWKVHLGHWDATGTYWNGGLWHGASLSALTVAGDPTINVANKGEDGGGDPWLINGTRYLFGHGTGTYPTGSLDPKNIPTELDYFTAPADITQPWTRGAAWWLRLQQFWGEITGVGGDGYGGTPTPDVWSTTSPTGQSQLADLSMVEVDGRTLMAYEDQKGQTPPLGNLSIAAWDAPLSRILDPAITHARGDDLVAEGWTLNSTETFPSKVFRKITRHGTRTEPTAVSPVSIEAVNEVASDAVYANRTLSLSADNVDIHALVRCESIAAGAWLDFRVAGGAKLLVFIRFNVATGNLEWYNGGTVGGSIAYTLGQYYKLRVTIRAAGWDLWIDGVSKGTGMAFYQTPFARPTDVFFGGGSGLFRGYLNALWWTKLAAAGAEPTW